LNSRSSIILREIMKEKGVREKKNHLQPIPLAQTHLKIIKWKEKTEKEKFLLIFLKNRFSLKCSAFFFIWRERASENNIQSWNFEKIAHEFLQCCRATMVENFFATLLEIFDSFCGENVQILMLLKKFDLKINFSHFFENS